MTRHAIHAFAPLVLALVAASAHARAGASGAAPPPATPPQSNAGSAQQAAAIEACNGKMQSLLAALDRGDYTRAEMDFNGTMKAGLPPQRLQQVWETLPAKFGKQGAHGSPQSNSNGTFVVVNVTTPYEKADIVTQVVCGADGKIAGFNAKAMTAEPSAAQS